jgi:hypothetical protein
MNGRWNMWKTGQEEDKGEGAVKMEGGSGGKTGWKTRLLCKNKAKAGE